MTAAGAAHMPAYLSRSDTSIKCYCAPCAVHGGLATLGLDAVCDPIAQCDARHAKHDTALRAKTCRGTWGITFDKGWRSQGHRESRCQSLRSMRQPLIGKCASSLWP